MARRSLAEIVEEVSTPPKPESEPLPRLLPLRFIKEDWRQLASCRGLTELFFSTDQEHVKEALSICSGCPVISQCADSAEANDEEHGTWGGLSEEERADDAEWQTAG
jgi:WhiB family redox-sensing transcriptional regulator